MTRNDLLKVLLVSLIFATVVGSGVYGFGTDYYAAYIEENIQWDGISDRLGFLLASLTVSGIHVGVYITSFLLACSVGFLVYKLACIYKIRKRFSLFITYGLIIHTWPVIMATSNVMRQGIMMSFIFFSLYFYLSGAWRRSIFFVLLALLSHKSAVLFVGLLLIVFISQLTSTKRIVNFDGRNSFVFITLLLMLGVALLVPYYFSEFAAEESMIIGGDFRGAFFLINIAFISFFFLLGRGHLDVMTRYLFLFSSIAPIFLFYGFNWEYARINMVLLIPYVLVFSRVFPRKYRNAYLFFISACLLAMTLYTGMYASFS